MSLGQLIRSGFFPIFTRYCIKKKQRVFTLISKALYWHVLYYIDLWHLDSLLKSRLAHCHMQSRVVDTY